MKLMKSWMWICILLLGYMYMKSDAFVEKEILKTIEKLRADFAEEWNTGDMNNIYKFYKTDSKLIVRKDGADHEAIGKQEILDILSQIKFLEADMISIDVNTALQLSPTRAYSLEKVSLIPSLEISILGSSMIIWEYVTVTTHGSGMVQWDEKQWRIAVQMLTCPIVSNED